MAEAVPEVSLATVIADLKKKPDPATRKEILGGVREYLKSTPPATVRPYYESHVLQLFAIEIPTAAKARCEILYVFIYYAMAIFGKHRHSHLTAVSESCYYNYWLRLMIRYRFHRFLTKFPEMVQLLNVSSKLSVVSHERRWWMCHVNVNVFTRIRFIGILWLVFHLQQKQRIWGPDIALCRYYSISVRHNDSAGHFEAQPRTGARDLQEGRFCYFCCCFCSGWFCAWFLTVFRVLIKTRRRI